MKIQEYVDIKNYSTFKIGGQFRYFIKIENKKDLLGLYLIIKKMKDIRICLFIYWALVQILYFLMDS